MLLHLLDCCNRQRTINFPPEQDSADKGQIPPGTKMIRLDDLIPKQDVKGGARGFFGGKNLKPAEKKPKK